jgi:hypothetical protein
MHAYQKSIGRQRAAALAQTDWWHGRSAREIAKFQLFTRELCLPFDIFHRAVEEALNRPVWIHEFGFDVDGLIHELLDERDPPTLEEILNLLPADKRHAVFVAEQWL